MNIAKTRQQSETSSDLAKAFRKYLKSCDIDTKNFTNELVVFKDLFLDKLFIINVIRKGITYDLFESIKNAIPFSDEEWAEHLNISTKTLQRNQKEADFHFKPIHTEKILELAEAINFGIEVFGSNDKFYNWLNTPSYALENYKPYDLLKDSYGKELVMSELNRIDHGIFA